jgi:rubrerythrin
VQKAATQEGDNSPRLQSLMHEMEMLHSTLATLKDLAAQQRDHLRTTQQLLEERARQGVVEIQLTQEMLTNERAFLEKFHEVLSDKQPASKPAGTEGEPSP